MQIQLKQEDIETAIKQYLASQGVTRGVTAIEFTKGRGGSGLIADIEMGSTAPIAEKVRQVPEESEDKVSGDFPDNDQGSGAVDTAAVEDTEKTKTLFS